MRMLLMATFIGARTAPVGVHWKLFQLQSDKHSDVCSHEDRPAGYPQMRYLS